MLIKTAGMAVVSVLLATVGQFLLKSGMDRVGYVGGDRLKRPIDLALTAARTPQIIVGLGIFCVSAIVWLIVLSRVPLSTAYPFAGITYVTTALVGRFVLGESIPGTRWLGILLIVGGILLVSRSAAELHRVPHSMSEDPGGGSPVHNSEAGLAAHSLESTRGPGG
jgi:multidrug transporter EmrE-like cation transporter